MVARCDAPRRTLCPTAWLVRAVRERHAFEKPGSRRTGFLFARFSNRSEPSRETGLKARSVRHVAPAFGKAKALQHRSVSSAGPPSSVPDPALPAAPDNLRCVRAATRLIPALAVRHR